jgi:signal transduction histidine kinase/DNA-binding NarL/FixJ family response regulator
MDSLSELDVSDLIERRYLGLVEVVRMVNTARDWKQLAMAISGGMEATTTSNSDDGPPGVRVWVITADGVEESARYPIDHDFSTCSPRELRRAARVAEPIERPGGALCGLQAGGVSLGVVEVDDCAVDVELLAQAAPVIASRVGLLAGQGVGDVLLSPVSVDSASDISTLMSAFASEAKRQLSHDRLSAYLLTCQGRGFERFAVATSSIVPGEGVIIPFEDVGLRHVVIANRALVSVDLATDPRVVGREDRVIAAAGFHGLLSVPLRVQGRPIGVLNFVSRTPGFYRDEDTPIAQQIADQVAGFIDNLHTQQRMRALISHESAERERSRVGRDVYHAVAQNVPEIMQLAEALESRLSRDRGDVDAQDLRRVRELAQRTLTDVRRAIADLLPRQLDAPTLEDAARAALAPLRDGDPAARIQIRGDTSAISPAARRAAARILQEAVTNVRLHADASKLSVSIECDRDLEMSIVDDGVGFDIDRLPETAGMGLGHMRERARALGGILEVNSAPGAGTKVSFELLGVGDAGEDLGSSVDTVPETAAAPTPSLRVFVIDRHPLMRAGLAHLAESVEGVRVVGEAENSTDARAQLRRLRPDVLLLDGHLPVADSTRLIGELRRELPMARIVIMLESSTGHEAELIEAGAWRFVNKTVGAEELADVVRGASTGSGGAGEVPAPPEQGLLSARERSILLLMSAGRTNTEIGQTLFLATKTVERQVATIIGKIGARNRAHAAALAVARRIVDPEQAG